jgi:hypothetical protein
MERLAPDYAFHFTEADLQQNRKGKLSDAQAALLRRDGLQMALLVCGALVVVTVLAFISAQGAVPGELQCVGLAVVLLILFAFYFFVMRTETAARPRKVEAVTGQAAIIYGLRGSQNLVINNRRFTITLEQSRAVEGGAVYTLYVVPGLNKIVALEAYAGERIDKPEEPRISIEPVIGEDGQDVLRA